MNRFSIVFLRTTSHSRMIQILVSLVPLTDTAEAQSRSGLEHLHLRINNCHNNFTYLITSTTLLVVSPRVVMQEAPHCCIPPWAHKHALCLLRVPLGKHLCLKLHIAWIVLCPGGIVLRQTISQWF